MKDYVPYVKEKDYRPEELTKFDAFSFRFVKFVEVALRFFATFEIYLYGEKSESLRNRLLKLDGAGFISEGEIWLRQEP